MRLALPNDYRHAGAVHFVGDQIETAEPCSVLEIRKELALSALSRFLHTFSIKRSSLHIGVHAVLSLVRTSIATLGVAYLAPPPCEEESDYYSHGPCRSGRSGGHERGRHSALAPAA